MSGGIEQREIQFRVWINQEHNAGISMENHLKRGWFPVGRGYWVNLDPFGSLHWGIDDQVIDLIPPKYANICMYTGLKDRNGVEIYEGDILRSETPPFVTFPVKWESQEWCEDGFFSGVLLYLTSDQYEVIGNIYENPELLP